MANHNLPTLTSTYANFITEMDARMDDISIGFDPAFTTEENPNYNPSLAEPTNIITGTIRWTSSGSKWQKWSGTVWNDLSESYAISISGNAATATQLATSKNINGVAFNGTDNISINLNSNLTVNSAGTGAVSGSTFNGSAPVTISYNSIGAPSVSGANATGTWGISITGSAATAGTATNTSQELTFNNGGSGAASGTTFNGGTARTISYNTIGAPSVTGTGASGSWGISVTGNAATSTLATKASTLSQNGGTGPAMTFNWSGQTGQPAWLWGGTNGTAMYVYNPSNFSVNYAASAGSAGSAANLSGVAVAAGGYYIPLSVSASATSGSNTIGTNYLVLNVTGTVRCRISLSGTSTSYAYGGGSSANPRGYIYKNGVAVAGPFGGSGYGVGTYTVDIAVSNADHLQASVYNIGDGGERASATLTIGTSWIHNRPIAYYYYY